MDYKLVCRDCGSENVLQMKWVNPNTNEVSSMTSGTEYCCQWCEDCNDETKIIAKDDFVPKVEEIEEDEEN